MKDRWRGRGEFSLAAKRRGDSLRAFMNRTFLLLLCALAFFAAACEQHPVVNHKPVISEPSAATKPETTASSVPVAADKAATAPAPADAPKFFPEQK